MRSSLISVPLMLLFAATLGRFVHAADTHVLAAHRSPGNLCRVQLVLEVGGELKMVDAGKITQLKMSVVGNMAYDELLFAADKDRMSSVRYYDQAEAVIKIENGGAKPVLPASKRLICADWQSSGILLFHPHEPLSREELDLITLPADSLFVDALLPEEPVARGQSWKHSEAVMAALLGLDAVSRTDAQSTLEEVTASGTARIDVSGHIEGAVEGVSTKIDVQGRYLYDPSQRRISSLTLLIQENRSIGHVASGLDVVSKLQMTISPLERSQELTEANLSDVAFDGDPMRTLLAHESTEAGFRLLHDRRWHAVNDDPKLLTMRYVDRGDLIAQCNLSPLPPAPEGKRTTMAKFQTDIQQALGDKFSHFLKAAEESDPRGWTIYRVVAGGTVSELPIIWYYYLIADGQGRQMACAFTLEEGLAERFADADRMLVAGIGFLDTTPTSADPPAPPQVGKSASGTPEPQAGTSGETSSLLRNRK